MASESPGFGVGFAGVFRGAASHSGNWFSVEALPSPAGTGGGGTHSSFL